MIYYKMKKIIILLTCLQSITLFGQTQIIEWQKSMGGSQSDVCNSFEITADGGYVMAGYTSSSDGDVTGNHGGIDYWIVKLDANRNVVWKKTLGGTGDDWCFSMQQTADNGFIMAGRSNSNNGDVSGNHGGIDCWIVKLNSNGNISWQKSLGGSGIESANSIRQTSDGGYIMAGYTASTDGDLAGRASGNSDDYWIVKLTATGNISWQKTYGGTTLDWAAAVRQTADGGYIVAGQAASSNGDVTGGHGSWDYWVLKLNASGNIVWKKALGGTGHDFGKDIQQTTDGGYILGGYTTSTDGDVIGNHGGIDGWVIKLDANGNTSWSKTIGGTQSDWCQAIKQTTDGGYILGCISQSTDGDATENKGDNDFWVVKLDNSGTISWQKSYGGTGSENLQDIQQVSADSYIIAGYSSSSDNDILQNQGFSDFWIGKLSPCSPVNNSINETACGSFTWTAGNGQTYNTSTTATHTFIGGAANGCDSIVTLNLTVNQPTNSSFAVTECEPYTWPLNNQTYTTSGAYTHVIPNANNCDSTITLNLTINQPTSSTITQTACGSYTLNGQTYTSSGTYTQVVSNAASCDSTITLNLTINDVNATVTASGIVLTASQSGATYQWIDCDNNDAPIAGATSQSFTPTQNGNYAVTITANGCTETSDCMPVNSVGIETVEQNDWSVYPNPGNGMFTIIGESLNSATSIKVTNALGQELKPATTNSNGVISFDITHETPGVYLLEINHRIVKLINQ